MDDPVHKAERYLIAMRERGERARAALERDDWEAYEKAMTWKTAAFHHFRSVDFILESKDPSYRSDKRWQELWLALKESDEALAKQMEIYMSDLNRTLLKLRKTKRAVGRYHSGEKQGSGFVDGI